MNVLLVSFVCYFVILLIIGFVFKQKQSTSSDFIGGGRKVNFWLTAISAHSSDMSVWALMAFPAAFFLTGMYNLWIAISLVIGMFLNWHFIAKKLRIETEKLNCHTLSTYFESHYKDKTHVLRILSALISVFFLVTYISAGLIAMGYLFEDVFGIEYRIGLLISMIVVISYVYTGGFISIANTDLFQGGLLLVAIISVPVIAYMKIDGFSHIIEVANQKKISLSLIPEFSLETIMKILALCTWGIGYFGQPHIITKFMGIRDPDEMFKSKYLGIAWQIVVLGAGMMIGIVGIAFFPSGLENPEMVFVEMTKHVVSTPLVGIVLCAIIAANMSTIASQILVCASSLSEDLYKYSFKKANTPHQLLKISRLSTILVMVFALIVALSKTVTIMSIVQYAWTGLGCSFGPLVIMTLYFKHANKYGAISGICIGGGLAALWPTLNQYVTEYPIPSMIPAFFGSLGSIYLFSLVTSKKSVVEVCPFD